MSDLDNLINYWESLTKDIAYQLADVSVKCMIGETIKTLKELKEIQK